MALQLNVALTTRSGFNVPSGTYCWLQEERGKDNKYSAKVDLLFFKDKASFDLGRERYTPLEISDDLIHHYQIFTAVDYGNLTSLTIHNFIKAQLEATLGNNTVIIVQ